MTRNCQSCRHHVIGEYQCDCEHCGEATDELYHRENCGTDRQTCGVWEPKDDSD